MMQEKILSILESINPELVNYSGENMLEDGLIESYEIMEIVTEIEELIGVEIEPDYIVPKYFANLSTLLELVNDIQRG